MSTVLVRSKAARNRRYAWVAIAGLAALGVVATLVLWAISHVQVERNPQSYAVVSPVELRVGFCRGAAESVVGLRVVETAQAVTVTVELTREGWGNHVSSCLMESRVVSLSSPLGNRPMVTPGGQPVPRVRVLFGASS